MNTFHTVSVSVVIATMLMATGATAFGQERGGRGEKRAQRDAFDATALTCVQNAIDARDNAIIMGLDAYYPAAKTAIQTRQAALKTAWTKFESDRKACNPKAANDDKGSLGTDNQL